MSAILTPIAIIAFLILLNGIFVAAEFAIVTAPYARIAQQAEAGSRQARRILPWLKEPARQNRYIATAQVGITIASLGLGMYGEHAIADALLGPLEQLGRLTVPAAHTLATFLAIALLTYMHVVIGEMVPKSIAIQHAEQSLMRLANPMIVLEKVFAPLVLVLNSLGDHITRWLGVPPVKGHERLFSPQELEFIMEESFEGGLLDESEQLYLENIFDFDERTVSQVMTPRTRIVGMPVQATQSEVLAEVCETLHSRYPVYEKDLDHIIGVLHIKTLARYVVNQTAAFDLRRLMRPPIVVPESLPLDDMMRLFRERHIHMAVVLDEFGGTAGLVTLEDLAEEVVGEIQDEHDEEQPLIVELSPGLLQVRGDLILDEINQHYELDLETEDAGTVGGLVMKELGRMPGVGDEVAVRGVTFRVQTVEGRAVQTVLVQLPGRD